MSYFTKRCLCSAHYKKIENFCSVKKDIFHGKGGLWVKKENLNAKLHIVGWYGYLIHIINKIHNTNKLHLSTKAHSPLVLIYLLSLSNWVHTSKVGLVYWVRLPPTCTVQNSKPALRQKAIERGRKKTGKKKELMGTRKDDVAAGKTYSSWLPNDHPSPPRPHDPCGPRTTPRCSRNPPRRMT